MDDAILRARFGDERVVAPSRCRRQRALHQCGGDGRVPVLADDADQAEPGPVCVAPDAPEADVLTPGVVDRHEAGARIERRRLGEFAAQPGSVSSPAVGSGDVVAQGVVEGEQPVDVDPIGGGDGEPFGKATIDDGVLRPVEADTEPLADRLGHESGTRQRRHRLGVGLVDNGVDRTAERCHHRPRKWPDRRRVRADERQEHTVIGPMQRLDRSDDRCAVEGDPSLERLSPALVAAAQLVDRHHIQPGRRIELTTKRSTSIASNARGLLLRADRGLASHGWRRRPTTFHRWHDSGSPEQRLAVLIAPAPAISLGPSVADGNA